MTQPLFRTWWPVGRFFALFEVQRLVPIETGDSACVQWLPHEPVDRLTDAEFEEHKRGMDVALAQLQPRLRFTIGIEDKVFEVQAAIRRGGSRPSDSRHER